MENTSLVKKITEKAMCEKHGEFEKVFLSMGRELTGREFKIPSKEHSVCPRCEAERLDNLKIEQARNQEKHEKQQVIYRIEHFDNQVPKRFAHATLENYKTANKAQKKVKELCNQYVESFDTAIKKSGGGLILCGKVGTGKTHIAIGIGKAIAERFTYVDYISLTSLVREIRSTWTDDTKNESTIINNYQKVGLLIVDEIGVQNGTDNERNILFEIIDGRYQNVLPTIIISNLEINEISEMISQRSVDRITQGGGIIPFNWASHRGLPE